MGDIITSSVRGEQPSQLSSIMPPHSTSRLQLMPPTQNSSSSTSLVQMRANTHVSSSVTDVVDILDVNYDDLFCDYNTLTTVNSVTNTRTIQQTPMFHGCTITNLNITINKWKCVKVSAFKIFEANMNWDYVRGKKNERKIKINKQKGNKQTNKIKKNLKNFYTTVWFCI